MMALELESFLWKPNQKTIVYIFNFGIGVFGDWIHQWMLLWYLFRSLIILWLISVYDKFSIAYPMTLWTWFVWTNSFGWYIARYSVEIGFYLLLSISYGSTVGYEMKSKLVGVDLLIIHYWVRLVTNWYIDAVQLHTLCWFHL